MKRGKRTAFQKSTEEITNFQTTVKSMKDQINRDFYLTRKSTSYFISKLTSIETDGIQIIKKIYKVDNNKVGNQQKRNQNPEENISHLTSSFFKAWDEFKETQITLCNASFIQLAMSYIKEHLKACNKIITQIINDRNQDIDTSNILMHKGKPNKASTYTNAFLNKFRKASELVIEYLQDLKEDIRTLQDRAISTEDNQVDFYVIDEQYYQFSQFYDELTGKFAIIFIPFQQYNKNEMKSLQINCLHHIEKCMLCLHPEAKTGLEKYNPWDSDHLIRWETLIDNADAQFRKLFQSLQLLTSIQFFNQYEQSLKPKKNRFKIKVEEEDNNDDDNDDDSIAVNEIENNENKTNAADSNFVDGANATADAAVVVDDEKEETATKKDDDDDEEANEPKIEEKRKRHRHSSHHHRRTKPNQNEENNNNDNNNNNPIEPIETENDRGQIVVDEQLEIEEEEEEVEIETNQYQNNNNDNENEVNQLKSEPFIPQLSFSYTPIITIVRTNNANEDAMNENNQNENNETENEELNRANKNLTTKLRKYKNLYEKEKKKNELSEARIRAFDEDEATLIHLRENNTRMKDENIQNKTKMKELENDISHLKSIIFVNSKDDFMNKKNTNIFVIDEELKKEYSRVSKENQEKAVEIEKLRSTIANLEMDLKISSDISKIKDDKFIEFEERYKLLLQQLKEIEDENLKLRKTAERKRKFKQDFLQSENRNKELNDYLAAKENEINNLKQTIEKLHQMNSELKSNQQRSTNMYLNMINPNSEDSMTLEQARAKLSKISNEKVQREEEIRRLKQELAAQESIKEVLNRQIKALQMSESSLKEEITTKDNQILNLNEKLNENAVQISTINSTKRNMTLVQEENDELNKTITQLKSEINKLNEKAKTIEVLKAKLDESNERVQKKKQKIAKLKDQIAIKDSAIIQYKETIRNNFE